VRSWRLREELGQTERLRRSYYELLRDHLDLQAIQYGLLDSYFNFQKQSKPYPFVEKRELKPRAKIPDIEYDAQNVFLTIFVEESIPKKFKKYIRFFDENKTTKSNLLSSVNLALDKDFDRNHRFLEDVRFPEFLKKMLSGDYALLIQRNPLSYKVDQYYLSHFHVRIDWPISEAAEDMARRLRYISKDLYERGEEYAEKIQKKFFEYYGVSTLAGGRRTAAVVAAQYLRRLDCTATIYICSSESRSLLRISKNRIMKVVLIPLSKEEMNRAAEHANISPMTFRKNFVIASGKNFGVCILQVMYRRTEEALSPEDGKLRELIAETNWLAVDSQYVLPKINVRNLPPIPINWIYT